MNPSKLQNTSQALHDIHLTRYLKAIRKWRDQPETDRAFLMGYNQNVPEPNYIVLLERPVGREPKSHKFRGANDLKAVEAAVQFLEMS